MAFTYQSVVDLARIPLNDADKTRYPDADLLSYANQGMLTIIKRRPDLFIGMFASLPDGEKALTDSFPLDAGYVQTIADYTTARAEMADDEHVDSGRAALYVQLFGAEAPA
jgi:uncharacterized protein DUF6682